MIEKRETVFGAGLKWFIIMMLGGFVLLFVIQESYNEVLSDMYFLITILVVSYAILRSWEKGKLIKERAANFAAVVGAYGYKVGGDKPRLTKIFRLNEQRDSRFINILNGEGWRYGDFTYNTYRRTKNGDYKAVEVYYSILELDLPRKLPHMFFDSPGSHGLQFLPHLDESQRTSLEGDFDKYFTTYFPMHYHIDARSIISPEVMAAMIDSGVSDIEIVGDKLYMYSPLVPVAQVPTFIKEGQEICKKLSDHIVFYRDEKLEDAANRKDVSIFGQNLRKKPRFPWVLLIFCSVLLTLIWFGSEGEDPTRFIVFAAVYIVVFVIEAYKSWWKVRRSNKAFSKRYKAHLATKKS